MQLLSIDEKRKGIESLIGRNAFTGDITGAIFTLESAEKIGYILCPEFFIHKTEPIKVVTSVSSQCKNLSPSMIWMDIGSAKVNLNSPNGTWSISFFSRSSSSFITLLNISRIFVLIFVALLLYSWKFFANKQKIKQLEIARRENIVNQSIAQTTQMLAHDVRKPFTLISALVQMVSTAKNSEQITKLLKDSIPEISSSLESVNGMIQDVMEVGKTDCELLTEAESVSQIIKDVLNSLFRFNRDANITITYRLQHQHKFMVNRLKISRVFSNIIANAIEHMKNSGELWFYSHEIQGNIEICIGNSKTYISSSDRAQLFEAFFTKGKKGGTGLGLAIAKKVVESHGGKIRCQSSRENGTEFFLTLPLAVERDDNNIPLLYSSQEIYEAESFHIAFEEGASHSPLKVEPSAQEQALEQHIIASIDHIIQVALIDDEAIYRHHLRSHLEFSEILYHKLFVKDFDTGEALLAEIPESSFDVIILDVDLGRGRLSGFDVVATIRKYMPNCKICIHSNRGALEYQSQALSAGADIFLPKPMTRIHLLKILASAMKLTDEQILGSISAHPSFPGKIIIIEDSPVLAAAWEELFEDNGDCEVFTTFADFLKTSQTPGYFHDVAAVIADYYLDDGKTCLDVIDHIIEIDSQLPIYLCTSSDIPAPKHVQGLLPKLPMDAINVLQSSFNFSNLNSEPEHINFMDFKNSLKDKKLLLVEDETLQRQYMFEELSSYINCEEASSYEEGIQKLEATSFDFLLADIHLNWSSLDQAEGLKLIAQAKEAYPSITAVAMSTDGSVTRTKAIDHFVEKPLMDADTIITALFTGFKARF